jgi:hypothetical protein
MVNSLTLKINSKTVRITSLRELLEALVAIGDEQHNFLNSHLHEIIKWVEKNFPKQLQLLAHLQDKTMTAQQLREQIVRDLRAITTSA